MIIKIRKATSADAKQIAELSQGLGYHADPETRLELVEKVITCACHTVIVAEVDKTLVGWLHAFYSPRVGSPAFYEIGGMVVDDKLKGKGIGKQLVHYVQAKYPGEWRVRTNEVREDAIAFYRALGFSQIKHQLVFSQQPER
ncbi:GNAT family N-acetyltransferase [Vibrio sonorensis]|uniref:GNAT family N-acetyltransferase n=1 Tax=Vibrio sonorensis TaxID=1004316 RepID=UPI0008DA63B9|nr:GNAT family N-acetyltransferase [Vibrio sonorensis]